MEDYITYEDIQVYSEDILEDIPEIESAIETASPAPLEPIQNVDSSEKFTSSEFNAGINELISNINPDTVQEDIYSDIPAVYASSDVELPDYVVSFDVNGVPIYFPTEYAEDIVIVDGMLINLGSSYTVGVQIGGHNVSNYLSSEITIPTYHSSTWYQYLQNYGQPYRVVDRYVSNNNYISSSTRNIVSLEFSGGNPWQGFTFQNIALFGILALLLVMFIFRKGSK